MWTVLVSRLVLSPTHACDTPSPLWPRHDRTTPKSPWLLSTVRCYHAGGEIWRYAFCSHVSGLSVSECLNRASCDMGRESAGQEPESTLMCQMGKGAWLMGRVGCGLNSTGSRGLCAATLARCPSREATFPQEAIFAVLITPLPTVSLFRRLSA